MNLGANNSQMSGDAGGLSHDVSLLEGLRILTLGKRVLVLGIGNRSRGDDAAGSLLADRLQGQLRVPVIDASDVPENYIAPIEESGADVVVVVDAADFGGEPGDVALLDVNQLNELGLSTHTAGLSLMFQAMTEERRPRAAVLAIQPASNQLGAGISAPVEVTLELLGNLLLELFGP